MLKSVTSIWSSICCLLSCRLFSIADALLCLHCAAHTDRVSQPAQGSGLLLSPTYGLSRTLLSPSTVKIPGHIEEWWPFVLCVHDTAVNSQLHVLSSVDHGALINQIRSAIT